MDVLLKRQAFCSNNVKTLPQRGLILTCTQLLHLNAGLILLFSPTM
jgi:hypothetical protein